MLFSFLAETVSEKLHIHISMFIIKRKRSFVNKIKLTKKYNKYKKRSKSSALLLFFQLRPFSSKSNIV